MGIRKGDRVKFLNDTGGGVVQEIKDSRMAVVLIDDGFEVPVLISELIPVDAPSGAGKGTGNESAPAGRRPAEEDDRQRAVTGLGLPDTGEGEEHGAHSPGNGETWFESTGFGDADPPAEIAARRKPERNLLLGLVESRAKTGLEVWLINDSRFSVLYMVLQKDEMSFVNIRTGHIEPDTKILIKSFTREEVNSFIALRLQAMFFMKGLFDPVAPAQSDFELDPVEIYSDGALGINDFFDENAMTVPLISDPHEREVRKIREQEVSRLIYQGKDISTAAKGARRTGAGPKKADLLVEEVDLHIEELVENHAGLSGREVLDIQMARFTTVLEGALRGKTKRVVFIHGVGNGKLKFEIRKTLDKKYSRLKYQDASFEEYGYGATMVIIRK